MIKIKQPQPTIITKPLKECFDYSYEDRVYGRYVTIHRYKYLHRSSKESRKPNTDRKWVDKGE